MDMLAKWAPVVVIACLIASLIGAWTVAPVRPFNVLGFIVGGMGITLLLARGMRDQFSTKEELGFTRTRDLIAYDLAGKGLPRGSFALGFAAWITWFVVGINSDYGWVAFGAFMLAIAWMGANARYPADPT